MKAYAKCQVCTRNCLSSPYCWRCKFKANRPDTYKPKYGPRPQLWRVRKKLRPDVTVERIQELQATGLSLNQISKALSVNYKVARRRLEQINAIPSK